MNGERDGKFNILLRPLFFSVSALIALISVTVAWFAANSRVDSGGMQVSMGNDWFELAAEGTEGLYFVPEAKGNAVTVEGKTLYKTTAEQPAITWMVGAESNLQNDEENLTGTLYPGASGKISFYILPKEDNSEPFIAKVKINRVLYRAVSSDGVLSITEKYRNQTGQTVSLGRLPKEQEEMAEELLKGHLLFFREYKEPYYSGWIQDDILEIPVEGADPVPVTIYWIWPYVFERLAAVPGSGYEPICEGKDYGDLMLDMEKNTSRYLKQLKTETENVFEHEKRTEQLTKYQLKYNRGDEYIGTNVDYLMLQLQAQ